MSEMLETLSPLVVELAPMLAKMETPERAGKMTVEQLAAVIESLRNMAVHHLSDAPQELAAAFNNVIDVLHRCSMNEAMRRGELMVDNSPSPRSSSARSPASEAIP